MKILADNPQSDIKAEIKEVIAFKLQEYLNIYGTIEATAEATKLNSEWIDYMIKGQWDLINDEHWNLAKELPILINGVKIEQIETWKAEHGAAFTAFTFINGKYYGCYFKFPSRATLATAMSFAARKDYISAGQAIVNTNWLGGNDFVKKDEDELNIEQNMACIAIFTNAYQVIDDNIPYGVGIKN